MKSPPLPDPSASSYNRRRRRRWHFHIRLKAVRCSVVFFFMRIDHLNLHLGLKISFHPLFKKGPESAPYNYYNYENKRWEIENCKINGLFWTVCCLGRSSGKKLRRWAAKRVDQWLVRCIRELFVTGLILDLVDGCRPPPPLPQLWDFKKWSGGCVWGDTRCQLQNRGTWAIWEFLSCCRWTVQKLRDILSLFLSSLSPTPSLRPLTPPPLSLRNRLSSGHLL